MLLTSVDRATSGSVLHGRCAQPNRKGCVSGIVGLPMNCTPDLHEYRDSRHHQLRNARYVPSHMPSTVLEEVSFNLIISPIRACSRV